MASVTPATSSTKETTHYARLCRVIVDVGTCALRDFFDTICSPPTLYTVLIANQTTLQSLRSRRIINANQWGKLFPAVPSSVSSRDFDITLLMILLRNICGLAPPLTGWDTQPAVTDVSCEADIARIKYFRNSVFAHAEHVSVDDATFNKHWKEIRDTLVRLGGATYKVAIDNLEFCCMDPDMEQYYKELLHQWKNDEDNIKDELKEIGNGVKDLTKKLDDLVASTGTPAGQSSDADSNGQKMEEILDTTFMCREKFHENELLTSFCKQCKVCICDKCRQTRHNHHTTVDIHQAAEEHKVDIEEIVEEMKREIAYHTERVERTKESLRRSRDRIATARNKVVKCVQELIRLLHEHEKTMITSLDAIDGKEHREHIAQLDHFEISRNQLQEHVELCEGILQRKRSAEILQAHKVLIGRSRGLLNADKLNIYKSSHVRYEKCKEQVENVRSAVPAVGRVLVSNTDPLQSFAKGKALHEGDVGSEATIRVMTKDAGGDQCYDENDKIYMTVRSPAGEEQYRMRALRNNGEYSVTFKPRCVGQHEVLIAVNGDPLAGSPWRIHVTSHHYKPSFSFGSHGKGRGQLKGPCSIAISDSWNHVAVADRKRVQLFNSTGHYLKDIGANKVTEPLSVAFSKSNKLVVISSGTIFCFRNTYSRELYKYDGKIINKHVMSPRHVTIARDGRVVLCNSGWFDDTVKVLSSDGSQLLLTISDPDRRTPRFAVCHQNSIFVSYYNANSVYVFKDNGVFLYSIGTSETGDELLNCPVSFAVDSFNNLVVCDQRARLQIFTLDGKFVSKIGEHTGLNSPNSVAVSSDGKLFVTDENENCVHVFQ